MPLQQLKHNFSVSLQMPFLPGIAGLADPYIKGKVGIFKFKTKVQRKTLCPKWMEEFKFPITSWETPNELLLEIHDKDPMFDDFLGYV